MKRLSKETFPVAAVKRSGTKCAEHWKRQEPGRRRPMDQSIEELAKTFKARMTELGVCVDQALEVMMIHEKRLQKVESTNQRDLLKRIEGSIEDMPEGQKKMVAMGYLASLCDTLGFESLESSQEE